MTGLVAHAGGTGWDEIAVFVAPVVVLLVLQQIGRRKKADDSPEAPEAPEGEDSAP